MVGRGELERAHAEQAERARVAAEEAAAEAAAEAVAKAEAALERLHMEERRAELRERQAALALELQQMDP